VPRENRRKVRWIVLAIRSIPAAAAANITRDGRCVTLGRMTHLYFADVQRGQAGAGLGGHCHRDIYGGESPVPDAGPRRRCQVQHVRQAGEREKPPHDHRHLGPGVRHGHRYVPLGHSYILSIPSFT
jgi:hypothetical protein